MVSVDGTISLCTVDEQWCPFLKFGEPTIPIILFVSMQIMKNIDYPLIASPNNAILAQVYRFLSLLGREKGKQLIFSVVSILSLPKRSLRQHNIEIVANNSKKMINTSLALGLHLCYTSTKWYEFVCKWSLMYAFHYLCAATEIAKKCLH